MYFYPLVLLFAVAVAVLAPSLADDAWVIREDGTGPVQIGMTLAQLNTTLHEKFKLPTAKDEQACFYVDPKKPPKVLFMIEDGKLSRIDVSGPGVFTSAGIQVGDTEKHALQVYGKGLRVEPHKYIDNGHYLTARSTDGRYGVRFETEDGKITSYYAGRYRSIQYVEGCE
jgi:hypothetical protein